MQIQNRLPTWSKQSYAAKEREQYHKWSNYAQPGTPKPETANTKIKYRSQKRENYHSNASLADPIQSSSKRYKMPSNEQITFKHSIYKEK